MTYTGENLSGGMDWPQYLVRLHPMKMWNFASSGAVVDNMITGGYVISPPMTTQYKYFNKNMASGQHFSQNWEKDKSMVVIWFGINDINARPRVTKYTSNELYEIIAATMFDMVEGLYKEGIRHFMFVYVPPMGEFPEFSSDPNNYVRVDVPLYNEIIRQHSQYFQTTHPDSNVFVYNAYDEFTYILQNSSQFNITNISDACSSIENLDSYFWADNYHPTPIVHSLLAEDMNDFLSYQEVSSYQITGYQCQNEVCWSLDLGYPCCESGVNSIVYFTDSSGEWSVEKGGWCGIPNSKTCEKPCWAEDFGYHCCSRAICRTLIYEDAEGRWDAENGQWCLITPLNTLC